MKTSFIHFLMGVLKIQNLSRAQVLYVAIVFDRDDPKDFTDPSDRETLRELFGELDVVPEAARHVVCTLKGARVGGTWLHSLFLLYSALTANLSGLALGERGYAIVVAPDMRLAGQALAYVQGAVDATPTIASCVTATSSTSVTLRRPQDGRLVNIEALPATRGGSAVRGRTLVACLLDEACFFRDADSGVVNDAECYRAVAPRILPGGLLAVVSTVWAESGLLWEKVRENHAKPSSCLAVIAPSLVMRDDDRMRQIVADERERDPENAAREFDCIPFAAGAGLFFPSAAITAAIDARLVAPIGLTDDVLPGVGVDTGLVRDSSAAVVVHVGGGDTPLMIVAEVRELRPEPGLPLKLSEVCAMYAEVAQAHGAYYAVADQHELVASGEYLDPYNVSLEAGPAGAAGKLDTYQRVRDLLVEGRLRIPASETRLIRQLRDVQIRARPGGQTKVSSPRRGGHGDLVSALVNAVHAAANGSRMIHFLLRAESAPTN